jgi:hypothetical protein
MFSVWSVLANNETGFSVRSAQRLYKATVVIFGIVQFQMRRRECSDSFSSIMSE